MIAQDKLLLGGRVILFDSFFSHLCSKHIVHEGRSLEKISVYIKTSTGARLNLLYDRFALVNKKELNLK